MSQRPEGNGLPSNRQSQVINFSINNSTDQVNGVRIGVISDTHISDRGGHIPRVILLAFKHVDLVIHAGDIVSLGVIDELKSVCSKVVVVAGNMDQEAVRKKYPLKQVLEIVGYRVGLMHGAGPALNLPELLKDAFKEDNCDLIIFGHSHKPMNERIGKVLFFNPGSATDLSVAYNSYGIIELKTRLANPVPTPDSQRPEGPGLPSFRQSQRPEGPGLPSFRQSQRPEGPGLPSFRQSQSEIEAKIIKI
jgi:putative phosphoesterase